jgi:hypothetical protein
VALLGERRSGSCESRPQSAFRARHAHGRLVIRGHSRDRCAAPIEVVQVAVARRDGARCDWLAVTGAQHRGGSCSQPFWLLARGGGSSWRLTLEHLPAGRYELRVRATAPEGRAERPRPRTMRVRSA